MLLLARSQELQGQTEAARATIDRLIVWLHTESLPEPLDQVCVLIASEINGLSREQLLGQLVEAAIHRRLTGLTRDVESAAETA